MISCSLGGNNTPNPGESCTFTCNTGYELKVVALGAVRIMEAGVVMMLHAVEVSGSCLIYSITRLLCKSICILKVNVLCALF